MGRSNGYRPTKVVRAEVLELRARLAELTEDKWQHASYIMQEITSLLGHSGAPNGVANVGFNDTTWNITRVA